MKSIIESCTCPHCGQKLTKKQYWEYMDKASIHYVTCSSCGRQIHPKKDPFSPTFGWFSGALLIVVPGSISLYLLHTNFATAIAISLTIAIPIIIFMTYYWYKHLFFE